MTKVLEDLQEWFRAAADSVIVALSGGVDSAVVAAAAKRALGKNAIAITADYKTLSAEELEYARRVAKELDIDHRVIEYSELENQKFIRNDDQRCYYCRTELGMHLREEAARLSISLIVDGTNLDDMHEYRPGIKAMREAGVRSPLVEVGMGKENVREIAKVLGLSVHDKPSNACLASRIPTGQIVTIERLRRIEQAEVALKSIAGIRQVRVRDHGDLARIEVASDEFDKILDPKRLALIDSNLKSLGYRHVTIDAAGYRAGNLVMLKGDFARA